MKTTLEKWLKRGPLFVVGAISLLGALNYFIYHSSINPECFGVDESDYMYSLEMPFSTHYLDKNTMPFLSFLSAGFSLGMKKNTHTALSNIIRSNDDVAFYRHFHGPFYFYYLKSGKSILGSNERVMRSFSQWLHFGAAVAVFLCCLMLLGFADGRWMSLLIGLAVLFCPTAFSTSALLTTHGMYLIWCFVSLLFIAKGVDTGRKRHFYASAIAIALAMATLEYTLFLMVCWLAGIITIHWKKTGSVRSVLYSCGTGLLVWFVVIMVVWPGSFLKLTLVKNCIFYAYSAIIRADKFTTLPVWQVWLIRISNSPVEYGISFAGLCLAAIAIIKKQKALLLPLVAYFSFIFLASVRNKVTIPTYTSSMTGVGVVIAGLAVWYLFRERKKSIPLFLGILACIVLVTHTCGIYLPRERMVKSGLAAMASLVRNESPSRLLCTRPMMPILHYYCPATAISSFTAEMYANEGADLQEIKTGIEDTLGYDGLIYMGTKAGIVRGMLAERYDFEQKAVSDPGLKNELIYFRLRPLQKRQTSGL